MTENFTLWKVRMGGRNLGSGNCTLIGLMHVDSTENVKLIVNACAKSTSAV